MWVAAALCAVACQVFVGSAIAGELPDGRVYERVSSLAQYGGEVYTPGASGYYGTEISYEYTYLPFQVSADGGKVAFVGSPTVGGNELKGAEGGNQYLATRLPAGGWAQSTLAPIDHPRGTFQAFSKDLTVGFLDSLEPLSPLAPGFGEEIRREGSYDVLYTTNTVRRRICPTVHDNAAISLHGKLQDGSVTEALEQHGDRVLAFAGAGAEPRSTCCFWQTTH